MTARLLPGGAEVALGGCEVVASRERCGQVVVRRGRLGVELEGQAVLLGRLFVEPGEEVQILGKVVGVFRRM